MLPMVVSQFISVLLTNDLRAVPEMTAKNVRRRSGKVPMPEVRMEMTTHSTIEEVRRLQSCIRVVSMI